MQYYYSVFSVLWKSEMRRVGAWQSREGIFIFILRKGSLAAVQFLYHYVKGIKIQILFFSFFSSLKNKQAGYRYLSEKVYVKTYMEIKSLHTYFVCASSDVRIQSLIICAKSHKEHTWGNRGLTWLTGPILILIHPQSRYCHVSFKSVHGGWRSISNAPKFKAGFSTYRMKNKP